MQADLISGLTVGVMAVPQSVSFAAMAGLPAAFGLYTAFVPVLAYCLVGSSRHLVSTKIPGCLPCQGTKKACSLRPITLCTEK